MRIALDGIVRTGSLVSSPIKKIKTVSCAFVWRCSLLLFVGVCRRDVLVDDSVTHVKR